ncbi:uncharacterized protein LOC144431373 [Styela clava]
MVDMEDRKVTADQLENNANQREALGDVETAQPGNQDNENKKNKFPGFNLYVKNLDDSFTDASLREAFKEFGVITSAKVMCDASGHSKGFGFVCFTAKDEADKALKEMNGRIVGSKPLYVAMAQKKEERKQYLSDKYRNFSGNPSVSFVPSVTTTPALQPNTAPPQLPEAPQVPYIPNNTNNIMQAPMQYRYVPNDLQWTPPGTYIVPPGHVNPSMTYMPYQPVLLVPGVNMVAPPQQMPILHQPIYIHSSKTNTLIYSTSVQTAPPQVSSPGNYLSTPSGAEIGGMVVSKIQQDTVSSHQGKDMGNNMTANEHQHFMAYTNNNNADATQLHTEKMAVIPNPIPDQLPANSNYHLVSHSNSNFAT